MWTWELWEERKLTKICVLCHVTGVVHQYLVVGGSSFQWGKREDRYCSSYAKIQNCPVPGVGVVGHSVNRPFLALLLIFAHVLGAGVFIF